MTSTMNNIIECFWEAKQFKAAFVWISLNKRAKFESYFYSKTALSKQSLNLAIIIIIIIIIITTIHVGLPKVTSARSRDL